MDYTKPEREEKVLGTHPDQATDQLSTRLQEFLWKNHTDHLFEVHPHVHRTPPVPYERALAGLSRGYGFFGITPRVGRGNKKEDCVGEFDVLWVDIDRWEGIDRIVLLEETKTLLPEGLYPSAVNFTGNKGLHCFWKLDSMLPIEEIEGLNRILARLVGGDRNCYDATRILAHPGTRHRKTGRLVETIEFSAEIHPVGRLDLLPHPEEIGIRPERTKSQTVPLPAEEEDWFKAAELLTCWGDPPRLDLVNWLLGVDRTYLSTYKSKGWRWAGKSRSEVEMHIVHVLVGKGASDDQIVDLADRHFSKHHDEASYRYIEITIRSARRHWYENGWLTHPSGGLRKKRVAKHRWGNLDEFERYAGLAHGQRLSEWVAEVEETGKSRASAYRYKDELVRVVLVEVREGRIFPAGNGSSTE